MMEEFVYAINMTFIYIIIIYEEELIIPIKQKCHCQIQLKNDLLVLRGYDLEIIKLEMNNTYKIIQVIEKEDIESII